MNAPKMDAWIQIKVEFHFKKDSKSFVFGKKVMHYNISQPSGEF